ncbi:protein DGS1, mitochondrial isoform X2 [Beta vulgaris subsp. vulgaris]|uniref:protein DGS1, mitochondrial isoform X2 n=1 Tax=Beta vulgaris subsp. vulgaris TaxID=3555 RepID=UPI002037010B|nr:protein DGS1, mitochondrial isoform X2 [Beta vulgaris subsp. vulgaris]
MNSETGGERKDMDTPSPSQENAQSSDLRTLTSLYSNYLWTRISNSTFITKISSFSRQFGRARSRRQKLCLPLPLPSKSLDTSLILTEASRIVDVLEDVFEHIFSNMHNVQKNLQYWQDKAEGSNVQKAYFMLFERGPRALIGETVEFVRNFIAEDSSFQILCHSASGFISERVAVLDGLRRALATFLAQVYMVIDKQREGMMTDPQKSLPSLLVTINGFFLELELSIAQLHVSMSQVARHQKPRKMTQYWVRYTCGAIGLSVCSLWVVRHSRLVGSPDIDNWIREAKESTTSFLTEHVEQPLLSIRDELFETFRKRHRGVMEADEVQLTANSLHRMLVAFCEQANGQTFPENATDQELLELVMGRYEKEMMHPIKSVVVGGELPRAMLIQVQKLKLDIETAMLELNQILKANEINFAILAALPAFVIVFLLMMLARSWIMQDKGAEGRGRIARRQRRLLIVEIEKRIMRYQSCMDLGQAQEAQYSLGLVLYTLDRLYRAVEGHAKLTGEWSCLRQDIIDLAKPDLHTTYKLTITSRMERVYDCLIPSLKQ